jgi:hypothetical protein
MASVRSITFTLGVSLGVSVVASNALAQTPAPPLVLTAAQTDVACAPAPYLGTTPVDAPYVVGNQDTVTRTLVGDANPLVINAGTDRGVHFDQRYFVRHIYRSADDLHSPEPHLVATTGWLHIIAVNQTMSLATVDHTCSHIIEGDYLEPFQVPAVPDNFAVPETTGELDFKALGRVLYGDRERWTAGTGEFMLIDRGANKNVVIGSHFAIYRDREVTGLPLTAIGEATAVSVGPALSVVRITQSRDAVLTRDIVVPRGPARSGVASGSLPGWQTSGDGGGAPNAKAESGLPESQDATLVAVATAIRELAEYGRLRSDGSTREATVHLRAANNIVRRLPRPKQEGQQGTPSDLPWRPTVDSVSAATSGDVYALVDSAIRQLTEFGSLLNDHAPREADERLMAAKRTVGRLQHLPR